MSEDGSLPESDDPFEVLGLEHTAERKEIRRAYARLAKRFRPERDPESFQRLRSAYEAALNSVLWREQMAESDDDDDADEYEGDEESSFRHRVDDWEDNSDPPDFLDADADAEAYEVENADSSDDDDEFGPSAIWLEYVETERFDEAEENLERFARENPLDVRVYLELYGLAARREREVDEAHVAFERGILAGASLFPFIFARISPFERSYLAKRSGFTWDTLRQLNDRSGSAFFFQERIESFLRDGEIDVAITEVDCDGLRADMEETTILRRVAQQVAAAAQWWRPEQAKLMATWAFDDETADYFERVYIEKGFRHEDWGAFEHFPEALERHIVVYDLLTPNGARVAALNLLSDIREDMLPYIRPFVDLDYEANSSTLLSDIGLSLESLGAEEDDDEAIWSEDDEELIEEVIAHGAWRSVAPPKKRMKHGMKNGLMAFGALAIVVGYIIFRATTGTTIPGFPLVIGLLVWVTIRESRKQEQGPPPIEEEGRSLALGIELVLKTGLNPMALAGHLSTRGLRHHRIPQRSLGIGDSLPVRVVYLLENLRRTLEVPIESPPEGENE